jgi:light-independent protochlorophyllide reductase subunit B
MTRIFILAKNLGGLGQSPGDAMKLTVWTYEGPPHVGAMRVATAMKGLHYVLHAPQGDTYADLLFTMIERRDHRPPVTYTTFEGRDLGEDTAGIFKKTCQDAYDRFKPQALIVGASCTAELIQDDPGGLAETMGIPVPVVALELPSYQRKENFGTDETFYQLVRALAHPVEKDAGGDGEPDRPARAGLPPSRRYRGGKGPALRDGDRHQRGGALRRDARGTDASRRGPCQRADVSRTCRNRRPHMERTLGIPYTKTVPIGVGATHDFVAEVAQICDVEPKKDLSRLRQPWWSKSVDSVPT